jgi:hypothetical protein
MKPILRCLHPLQAEHYANVLRACGFACEVRGAALYGAVGDIPWHECAPEVWLRNDEQEHMARRMLDELASSSDGEPWTCGRCGEPLEPQFGACWRCGQDRGAPLRAG